MPLKTLLDQMWVDYCDLNPAAKRIYTLLMAEGETVQNDHIALRTLRHPRLGIESLAKVFKKLGYIEKGDYHFDEKKLYAKHYEHSSGEEPKIFISELLVDQFSPSVQWILNRVVEMVAQRVIDSESFSYSGRTWDFSFEDYKTLSAESEYAAWLCAIGFRPNHFTVFLNGMKKYNTVERMNQFLVEKGYKLNVSGGAIKGSPRELLEQSSIMAEKIEVLFKEGASMVPGCYYEFARRYPKPDGQLYQGFVAASADKIFESTNQ